MERNEVFEKVIKAFQGYYNVKTEDVKEPFMAEAEFHSHDVNYFLSKSAKLFECDSNEYVYFASLDQLDLSHLQKMDEIAWNDGLSKVNLEGSHKATDVTMIVIADHIASDCISAIKKMKHYKSYMFTLKGWSNYRLIALEVSTGKVTHNRQGESLKKLLCDIVA